MSLQTPSSTFSNKPNPFAIPVSAFPRPHRVPVLFATKAGDPVPGLVFPRASFKPTRPLDVIPSNNSIPKKVKSGNEDKHFEQPPTKIARTSTEEARVSSSIVPCLPSSDSSSNDLGIGRFISKLDQYVQSKSREVRGLKERSERLEALLVERESQTKQLELKLASLQTAHETLELAHKDSEDRYHRLQASYIQLQRTHSESQTPRSSSSSSGGTSSELAGRTPSESPMTKTLELDSLRRQLAAQEQKNRIASETVNDLCRSIGSAMNSLDHLITGYQQPSPELTVSPSNNETGTNPSHSPFQPSNSSQSESTDACMEPASPLSNLPVVPRVVVNPLSTEPEQLEVPFASSSADLFAIPLPTVASRRPRGRPRGGKSKGGLSRGDLATENGSALELPKVPNATAHGRRRTRRNRPVPTSSLLHGSRIYPDSEFSKPSDVLMHTFKSSCETPEDAKSKYDEVMVNWSMSKKMRLIYAPIKRFNRTNNTFKRISEDEALPANSYVHRSDLDQVSRIILQNLSQEVGLPVPVPVQPEQVRPATVTPNEMEAEEETDDDFQDAMGYKRERAMSLAASGSEAMGSL